jgi:hypothetical protein
LTKENFNKLSVAEYSIFELGEVKDINPYSRELTDSLNKYNLIKKIYDENVLKRPNVYSMTIPEIAARRDVNKETKLVLNTKVENIKSNIHSYTEEINLVQTNKKNITLKQLEENVRELEKVIKENEEIINIIDEKEKPSIFSRLEPLGFTNEQSIDTLLNQYKEILANINDCISKDNIGIYNNLPKAIAERKELQNELYKINDEVTELKSKTNTLADQIELEDMVNKRPESCKIDSCPFISKLLSYKGVRAEYDRLYAVKKEKSE